MDIQAILFLLVTIDVVSSVVRAIVDVLEYKQNHKPKRRKKPDA
ncbi:MAG: hypothetical protein QMD43_09900 [Thermodesulfovibrio sp.]|nr:hypothetical protein [Thermodesulfovibrio sp.]